MPLANRWGRVRGARGAPAEGLVTTVDDGGGTFRSWPLDVGEPRSVEEFVGRVVAADGSQ